MTGDPTHLGVYVAVILGLAFLASHAKNRRRPDLGQFSTVFLAAVAAVVAIDFGQETLRANSQCVTACEDQRLPMVLGAIAVTWITVSQIWKSFYRVLSHQPKKLGTDE